MNLVEVLFGIVLIILGFIWLNYQIKETAKYKKEESYGLLSTQPSQYIGIFILIFDGALIIFRAF